MNLSVRNKKGAMEMSVGTIVTIVLLMSVLILGLFLVRNIFGSAKGAIDLTDSQLQTQVSEMFGSDDTLLVLYPQTRFVEIKAGEIDAIGIGVTNKASTLNAGTEFSYSVSHINNECGLTETQAMSFVAYEGKGTLSIPQNRISSDFIRFSIPENAPICLVKYKVVVNRGSELYDSQTFEIEIK